MNRIEALQLLALKSVLKPDEEYNLRYIFRWYSKTFSTPLHVVPSLDLDHILTAFLEERYEAMTPEEREQEKARLLESAEERWRRELEEDIDDMKEAELIRMSQEQNAKNIKNKQANSAPLSDKGAQVVQPESLGLSTLPETEHQRVTPEKLPPNIKIEFVDDGEMEQLLNSGFANQTKTPTK